MTKNSIASGIITAFILFVGVGAVAVSNPWDITQKIIVGLTDAGGIPVEIDNSTHALETVDYAHHELHSGSHYTVNQFQDIAQNGALTALVRTASSSILPHMLYGFTAEGETEIYVYEGATVSATGTAAVVINNRRDSTNLPLTKISFNASASGGTKIWAGIIGGGIGQGFGGQIRGDSEYILKPATDYMMVVSNKEAGVRWFDVHFGFYEHADKDTP